MSASCPLCGGRCAPRFSICGFSIHRCSRCDLERVWPLPDDDALRSIYTQSYFRGPGAGYADYYARERSSAAKKSATRLDRAAELGVTSGRYLDVGCAAGFFLEHAQDRGFEVVGVEPSDEARAAASAKVQPYIVASIDGVRGDFDLITLWDVLEHLRDPLETLSALAPRLRPGGLLGVVVPVLGSINTRVAPTTWDQYKPPEHLWYFSPNAMRKCLQRSGFDVVHEEPAWVRPARFVDPEGTRREPVLRGLRSIDAALHAVAAKLLGASLCVDSMLFFARGRGA